MTVRDSREHRRLPLFGDNVRRARGLALLGAALLLGFCLQAIGGMNWPLLESWQQSETYKLVSGSCLVVFVATQWLLTLARASGWHRFAKHVFVWHQRLGVLTPLALFVHSIRFGFGYLALLSGLFLGNALVGLVSPRIAPQLRKVAGPWLALHVALAVALLPLVVYHIWVALYFE